MTTPIVATDRTRKHVFGVAPTTQIREGAWTGVYAAEASERVYGEVLRRAACVLASGRSVIVDGSFRSREQRGLARLLARQMRVPFLFVECRATHEVCRARLRQREQQASVSDARIDLFDDFVKQFQPVDELSSEEHVIADTSTDLEAAVRKVGTVLPLWAGPGAQIRR